MLRQGFLFATVALLVALTPALAETEEEYQKCIEAIKNSDLSENDRMNKDPEYILFLKEITGDEFVLTTYDYLPAALQMNYEIYEYEGVIDISGATIGENATRRQKRITETLCETTYLAIDAIPQDDPYRTENYQSFASTTWGPTEEFTNFTDDDYRNESEDEGDNQVNSVDPVRNVPLNLSTTTYAEASIDFTLRGNLTGEAAPASVAPNASEATTIAPLSPNTSIYTPAEINTTIVSKMEVELVGNWTSSPGENATEGSQSPSTTFDTQSSVATESSSAPINATIPPTAALNGTSPNVSNETSVLLLSNITESNSTQEMAQPPTGSPSAPPTEAPSSFSTPQQVMPTLSPVIAPLPSYNSNSTVGDPFSTCKMVMKYSDINADGFMNSIEYVWFLNDNWDSPYPGAEFEELPQGLQNNFFKFAEDGEMNMTKGEDLLNDFCEETELALNQVNDNSVNAAEEAAVATFSKCLASIAQFDANGDAFLEEVEYVALISDLSDGTFANVTFADMPEALRREFKLLSEDGKIGLRGATATARPRGSVDPGILDNLCGSISYALQELSGNEVDDGDFEAVDSETMIGYASCMMKINTHDENQDSKLDEEEYVGLVNRLAKEHFRGIRFDQLPFGLRDNFFRLESNGTIAIEGSQKSKVPSNEEQQFLGRVCMDTIEAIKAEERFEYPQANASGVDMGEPIVIHSAFNIYSDALIPENEFIMGPTRELLQSAYKQFVMEVVDGLGQVDAASRKLVRQAFDDDSEFFALLNRESPIVNHIIDLDCAGASPDALCKTVFAQYEISPIKSMDRTSLYEEYVRVTQAFIDSGLLQNVLEQVDPETLLAVIGASSPVIYEEAIAEDSVDDMASNTDDGYEEEMAKSKKKTIAFIAMAVSCVLIASLAGLVAVRLRRQRAQSGDQSSQKDEAGSIGHSVDKASDTNTKDEFQQEEDSSQRSHSSRGYHSGSADSHDDDDRGDEEIGKMSVIDLCDGVNAAANDFEARNNQHTQELSRKGKEGFPPLRKKANGEIASSESGDISFAFRRYSIDGENEQVCL